ncbi:uncharacterized protein LOC105009030 isoform X1 [Tachysurus ichikawai]
MDTQRVVLSFGQNDRTTKYPALYQQQITKLIHAAGDTFPNATLHVPSVSFDRRLPHGSRANLDSLNRIIGATGLSIPILPREGFQTLPDNIHWTLETANAMWEHWSKHLNLTGQTPPDRGPSALNHQNDSKLKPRSLNTTDDWAIKSLKNNKSIVIKPADKGNGVVIMDRSDYIRDTYDFIDKVKSARLEPRSLLFIIDINDLYTNIDTAMGLKVVKQWLVRYPDEGRPDDIIMDLLELNLTKNDFEFNGEFHLQVKGTAMGKKFAPAYANIYMAHWGQTALAKCSKLPTYYFRYLDDICGVWDHMQEQFLEFVAILNNHRDTIKLKHTLHRSQVDFLDTTTYKGKDFNNTGKLDIKVFFKETDSHALLHGDSYHPKHTFRGIIKAQTLTVLINHEDAACDSGSCPSADQWHTLLNIGSYVAKRKPDFEFLNAGALFTNNATEPFVWAARTRSRKRCWKRGKRASVFVRLGPHPLRPPLPTILLANVQSLDKKL